MTDTILCIDIGTTSLKAALLSDRRTVEAKTRVALEKGSGAGGWISALKKAVAELKSENESAAIEAICVSGNGPTLVLERDGDALATLLWNAPTPKSDSPKTESLYIPRMIAARKVFPGEWEKASSVMSGPEFLIKFLTGNALTILPAKGFEKAYWSDEELRRFGFGADERAKLPPFKKMGSFAGKICEKAAIGTGLLEGTLVFAGAPDFVVALIGTGTIYPGKLCDRAGSSEGINLCTSKPIFADGIRTLPSAIPGLWNASALIPDSGRRKDESPDALLEEFSSAIEKLRNAAEANGELFPDELAMTGGQCLDKEWISRKEKAAGMNIRVPFCNDAELIGDLVLARLALGDYDDMDEACFVLCGM